MKISEKKLAELATIEATNLRNMITSKERKNLNLNTLSISHREHCIYGQLTGNCDSPRAYELMKKCASKVYKKKSNVFHSHYAFDHLSLSRGPVKTLHRDLFWSPIEVFLIHDLGNQKNQKKLLGYIKGTSKTLKLVS